MKLVSSHTNRSIGTSNNKTGQQKSTSTGQPIKLHSSAVQISIHPDVPHMLAQKQIKQATQRKPETQPPEQPSLLKQPGQSSLLQQSGQPPIKLKPAQPRNTQSPIQFLESSQRAASTAATLSASQREALQDAIHHIPRPLNKEPVATAKTEAKTEAQPRLQQPRRRPAQERRQNRIKEPIQTERRPVQRIDHDPKPVYVKRKSKAKKALLIILLTLIISGGAFAGWYYWWTTYAEFDYRIQPIVILSGQNVDPNDFLIPGEDTEETEAVYRRADFRPEPGRQNVHLTLTMGWRSVDTAATLYVLTPREPIRHEFREPGYRLDPVDLLSNADIVSNVPYDVRFTEDPLPLEQYEVGEHTLHLTLNGAPFEVMLQIVDTTPPYATAETMIILIGEDVAPEDFVTDVFDASGIESITFVDEPDLFARTDQIVQIRLEDPFGNYFVINSALTIQLNSSDPVIEGTETIVSQIGIPILYRQGVSALDSFGRLLEIDVDSSDVDQQTVGVYTAIYSATDLSGRSTKISVEVNIIDVDIEEVHRRVDEVLFGVGNTRGIINDNMSEREKVLAIHRWVRWNVWYAAVRGGPRTAYEGAEIALRERRGNCYIFYSISEVMLDRAGIDNMRIERIEGTPTRHRWNLVNPKDENGNPLGWHHFDSFPTRLGLGDELAFFTSTEADRFSQRIAEHGGLRQYFTYDPEEYPEIVQ